MDSIKNKIIANFPTGVETISFSSESKGFSDAFGISADETVNMLYVANPSCSVNNRVENFVFLALTQTHIIGWMKDHKIKLPYNIIEGVYLTLYGVGIIVYGLSPFVLKMSTNKAHYFIEGIHKMLKKC